MKALFAGTLVAAALMLAGIPLHAQYKAPSQYFRKDSPGDTARKTPGAPGAPATPAPAKPKFKDLPVNSPFYFVSDTNRVYTWTKISDSTAKNTKNGITQTIHGETLIQR